MRRENMQSEGSYWKQSDGVPKVQTENNNVRKMVGKKWKWFIYLEDGNSFIHQTATTTSLKSGLESGLGPVWTPTDPTEVLEAS